MERKVLAAILQDRASYEDMQHYLVEEDLSDVGQILYKMMSAYYQIDPTADSIDPDLLEERVGREYPKHEQPILAAIKGLTKTSSQNVRREYLELRKERVAVDLAHALLAGDKLEIAGRMEEWHNYSNHLGDIESIYDDTTFIGEPVNNLIEAIDPANLIRVFPNLLNERLGGGVPQGSHMLLYARPEAGKTATAINMSCGFIKEGRRTLYVGNEDPHNMMILRIVSRLSGMTRNQIMDNPQKAQHRANDKGYDNLVFASLAPGSMTDIRRLVDKHDPECLVIDQLHNLSHSNSNKVEKLELLATEARNLTKERGLVTLSLTQAADSADQKQVLDMGDVYYSNTGIPGQMDVMIGLGFDSELEKLDRRYMSLAKNKLTGDHSPFQVSIDRHLSKITSL